MRQSGVLTQAGGMSLMGYGSGDHPGGGVYHQLPREQESVGYLISNGQGEEGRIGGAASSHSRFKSKQPVSYNDFYYSQRPTNQGEYAQMLQTQVAQKQEFSHVQDTRNRNMPSLQKVNNINPHLIEGPANNSLPPGMFSAENNLKRTVGGFQCKHPPINDRHLTKLLIEQPPSQVHRLASGVSSSTGLRDNRQQQLASHADSSDNFMNRFMPSSSNAAHPRGVLQRENLGEREINEKERKQRELNLALNEQIFLKKKRQAEQQRRIELQDIALDQKLLIAQQHYKQTSQSPPKQPPPPPIQPTPASNHNRINIDEPIKSMHLKSDRGKRKVSMVVADDPDAPDFTRAKHLLRTPPERVGAQPSNRGVTFYQAEDISLPPQPPSSSKRIVNPEQRVLSNNVRTQNVGGDISRAQTVNLSFEMQQRNQQSTAGTRRSVTHTAAARGEAVTAGARTTTRQKVIPEVQEQPIDYFEDYYELQQRAFDRQMIDLQEQVSKANASRKEVFRDMLQLREKSKLQHMMTLVRPGDVLEDNRYILAQQKQNMYNNQAMQEVLQRGGGGNIRAVEYNYPAGTALHDAVIDHQLSSQTQFVPIYIPGQERQQRKDERVVVNRDQDEGVVSSRIEDRDMLEDVEEERETRRKSLGDTPSRPFTLQEGKQQAFVIKDKELGGGGVREQSMINRAASSGSFFLSASVQIAVRKRFNLSQKKKRQGSDGRRQLPISTSQMKQSSRGLMLGEMTEIQSRYIEEEESERDVLDEEIDDYFAEIEDILAREKRGAAVVGKESSSQNKLMVSSSAISIGVVSNSQQSSHRDEQKSQRSASEKEAIEGGGEGGEEGKQHSGFISPNDLSLAKSEVIDSSVYAAKKTSARKSVNVSNRTQRNVGYESERKQQQQQQQQQTQQGEEEDISMFGQSLKNLQSMMAHFKTPRGGEGGGVISTVTQAVKA